MYTLYLYTEDNTLKQLYTRQALEKADSGDAGIDLYVPDDLHITDTSSTTFLNHKIVCRMTLLYPNAEEADVSYYLYPRSSMAKTRLRLANSVGIIDSGYRGPIITALDARGEEIIAAYTRLVQLCSPTLEPVRLVVVDHIDTNTARGAGGFGSTGK
jgi:dUTP pyrophosphatase